MSPLRSRANRRGVIVACSAVLAGALGCASDAPQRVASIGLSLAIPKALIDVDRVNLYVFDQAAAPCKGAAITVAPAAVPEENRVFALGLAKCNGDRAWCGTGEILQDPERILTFYVEGRYTAKKGGFTGCVERAVDQNPLQIEMRAQPLIEGVICGDVAVGYGETCDPGGGAVDEACDGTVCKTKEVIVSKGAAAQSFYRGRPGRKTGVGIQFAEGKFYGVWSDQALGGGGDDGANEISARVMSGALITETTPAVLASEVRLPSSTGPNTSGTPKRGSSDTAPTMVPLGGGNLLFVFLRDTRVHVAASDNRFNTQPDAPLTSTTSGQSAPHAAASAAGDALIAFVEGNTVRTVLRKANGTLNPPQTISGGGTVSRPRVASVGADFIVVWSDGNDIKLRRIGGDGMPKGAEARANENRTAGVQDQPDVAGLASGEFIVVWRDAAGDVGADIRVQKFDKAGAPTGTEIAEVLNDVNKTGDQDQPVVAAGVTPNNVRFYLVAWRTTNNIGARFVRVDETGFLVSHAGATTSEFLVGEGDRPRSSPAVAVGSATAPYCVIGWADDSEGDAAADDDRVRARRLPMPDQPQ